MNSILLNTKINQWFELQVSTAQARRQETSPPYKTCWECRINDERPTGNKNNYWMGQRWKNRWLNKYIFFYVYVEFLVCGDCYKFCWMSPREEMTLIRSGGVRRDGISFPRHLPTCCTVRELNMAAHTSDLALRDPRVTDIPATFKHNHGLWNPEV